MFMTGLITGGIIGTVFGFLISSLCVISKSEFDIDLKERPSTWCEICDIKKKDGDTAYCLDCPGAKK